MESFIFICQISTFSIYDIKKLYSCFTIKYKDIWSPKHLFNLRCWNVKQILTSGLEMSQGTFPLRIQNYKQHIRERGGNEIWKKKYDNDEYNASK